MPGIVKTPFFSTQKIWNEQPQIAAYIRTETAQAIGNAGYTQLLFTTPINHDPLNLNAWRTLWDATAPQQFTIAVRGWYSFGSSVVLGPMVGHCFMELRVGAGAISQSSTNVAGEFPRLNASVVYPAVAGDVFTVHLYQASGFIVNTTVFGLTPAMWIVRIG